VDGTDRPGSNAVGTDCSRPPVLQSHIEWVIPTGARSVLTAGLLLEPVLYIQSIHPVNRIINNKTSPTKHVHRCCDLTPTYVSDSIQLGMAMGQVQIKWSKNPTHGKTDSGEKSHPHPYPRVEF
jgi:hypothetical protein